MISSCGLERCVSFHSLEFREKAVLARSLAGVPYYRTVRSGVPRIPAHALTTTVFLYRSIDDAISGNEVGGTGFLVGIETVIPGSFHVYFVTNWHVACSGGASVVRVNKHGGGCDVFEYDPSEWQFLPSYDIAVIPASLNSAIHDIGLIPLTGLLRKENKEKLRIGPGDDVFMVGRFVDHGDTNINMPAVRFGNISMDPAPIAQPNGIKADAYCIDMHSRSGFLGPRSSYIGHQATIWTRQKTTNLGF